MNALHANPSAGNLITCMAMYADSGTITATFTDSLGNKWYPIGSKEVGVNTLLGFSGQMFEVPFSKAGADTITATASTATTFFWWECTMYSYTPPSAVFDETPIYSNTAAPSTTATIGTIPTTNTSGLICSDVHRGRNGCLCQRFWIHIPK